MAAANGDEEVLTSLEWTDEEVIALNEAMIDTADKVLLPVGLNKNFNLLAIRRRFEKAINKKVHPDVLWERFNDCYDLEKLDKMAAMPFPNELTEFQLPDDFKDLIEKCKSNRKTKVDPGCEEKNLDDSSDYQQEINDKASNPKSELTAEDPPKKRQRKQKQRNY